MVDVDIETLKKRIVDRLRPINAKKIILFGSYAYGHPSKDSDLDICIIKDNIISKREEKSQIRRYLNDIKIPMDILLVDKNYYNTHSDEKWINTTLYEINKKGEILYEKE